MELDKERLAKLLNMTGSDHDAEALAAVRKANEFLRLHRKSWRDVLGSRHRHRPSRNGRLRPRGPGRTAVRPSRRAPARAAARPSAAALLPRCAAPRAAPAAPAGFSLLVLVELLALAFPNSIINTRGQFIAIVFALGMLTGIAGWIWLGYYLLFVTLT